MITGVARVAGVVGWPVKHSLSPLIHNAWIAALGLDAAYVPFEVAPERFESLVRGLSGGAAVGLNVTLPHKSAAFALADQASETARAAQAANLLRFSEDGTLVADNTDGVGLLAALKQGGWRAEGGSVVVLGAGGAAAGAIAALTSGGATQVRVAARRREAAEALVQRDPHRLAGFGFDQIDQALEGATAVINATSAGLNGAGELPPMDAAPPGAVFMDMVYSPLRTPFLRRAAARGHLTVDGLAMLIGQARPSFEAFFGVPAPPTEVVDMRALCLKALGEAAADSAASLPPA